MLKLKILIGVIIFVVSCEGISRLYFFKVNTYSYSKFYYLAQLQISLFEKHPYLIAIPKANIDGFFKSDETSKAIHISHNSMGTRDTLLASSNKNEGPGYAMLGGSAVYGAYLSDDETWPSLTYKKLGSSYSVYNLGVPGYTSLENLIQTATVLPSLKVKYAIYFMGFNDLIFAYTKKQKADYSDFHARMQFNLIGGIFQNFKYFSRSAFFYFLCEFISPSNYQAQPPASSVSAQDISGDRGNLEYSLQIYRNNINSIIAICRAHQITPIFIPQILSPFKIQSSSSSGVGWVAGVRTQSEIIELMKTFNEQLKSVAQRQRAIYATNLENVKYEESDFVNIVHFTASGSEKFSEALAEYLKSNMRRHNF